MARLDDPQTAGSAFALPSTGIIDWILHGAETLSGESWLSFHEDAQVLMLV